MHRRILPSAIVVVLLAACRVEDPGAFPSRRLTPTEYNHTIRDLMGFEPDSEDELSIFGEDEEDLWEGRATRPWPWRFPEEVAIHGFEGHEDGQISSPYLTEQYQAAAVHFSALMLEAPDFWTCDPEELEEEDDEDGLTDCARDSVLDFGRRAYRRPLTDGERSRLLAFFRRSVDEHGPWDGARLAVQGVLMAPQFLYRLEPRPSDGKRPDRLDDFALASRLSYFLWDSMPDEELLEAAERGDLRRRRKVEAQVARMLEDPRARQGIVRFHEQWLDIDRVYSVSASQEAYQLKYLPESLEDYDADDLLAQEDLEETWSSFLIGARAGMAEEARRFIETSVFDRGGDLETLLTDHRGYVTLVESSEWGEGSTAGIYGVDEDDFLDGERFEQTLFDGNLDFELEVVPAEFPEDQRSGVLTLGAVLAGHAHPVHPAPILRGVFVLERLGCETLGQPPDGAAGSAPADTLDADATNRARLEAVTAPQECTGCHTRINPVGFAFENFDSLGGWRTKDNGQAIDASGTLVLGGETLGRFRTASELGQLLARSERVHDCYALNWMRYALGRDVDATNPHLQDVQARFRETDGDVLDLVTAIATSDQFRYH